MVVYLFFTFRDRIVVGLQRTVSASKRCTSGGQLHRLWLDLARSVGHYGFFVVPGLGCRNDTSAIGGGLFKRGYAFVGLAGVSSGFSLWRKLALPMVMELVIKR